MKKQSKTITFKTPKKLLKLTKKQKAEIDRIKKWERESAEQNILIN